jgi:hypothetical protein
MGGTQARSDGLAGVPVFAHFPQITETDAYRPLPEDWAIGCADVVASTKAIAKGRYKTVNAAGAAVISAVANAVGHRDFPFVFGGDGACFAIPPDLAEPAGRALAATATFVREELDLDLRVGMMPMAAIRAAGLDVRLAYFAASPNVSYAMFSGGGIAFAEAELKAGRHGIEPAAPGTRPDLTGLSCSFEEIPARRGVILSLIVRTAPGADPTRYLATVDDVLALAESGQEHGRPLPAGGPVFRQPFAGLDLQTRIARRGRSSFATRLKLLGYTTMSYLIFRLGLRVGGFDPSLYVADIVANSDYRKYDDGLRMTIDCTPDLAATIEERLAAAAASGEVQYGLHRQRAALMTCITPSPTKRDHIHFIDGAAGGYAAAAAGLKAAG